MLKLMGAVLITAVMTAFGIKASGRLRGRFKVLGDFCLFVGEISDGIRVGSELDRIFRSERAKRLCSYENLKIEINREFLKKEDERLIDEFFNGLGMSDAEAAISRCEAYKGLLQRRANEAEEDMKARSRLYGILGAFSGIFISILLV